MRIHHYYSLVPLFLLLACTASSAQADTALLLPVAEVKGQRLRADFVGQPTVDWDSASLSRYRAYNLSDLLERESGVFVKSYGLGSSATTSIRGGSASHTAVTWNGLPLQSPMLGQLDFSLLPMLFVDEAQLQRGGNTASWGSGALGGTVGLLNEPLPYEGAEAGLRATLGSFGLWDQQVRARWRGQKWSLNTRLFHRQARNDFDYQLSNGERRQQEHAALQQQGVLQEVYWQASERQRLALLAWWQTANRELPPLTTQNTSLASQRDSTLRTSLQWRYLGDNAVWHLRLGWFREAIDYRDELIQLRSPSHFHTLLGEAEGQWQLSADTELEAGFFYNYTNAQADGYRDNRPQQDRQALFASLRHQWGALSLQGSLRQALVDGQLAPFVPALGLEYQWLPRLKAQLSLRRNYRIPTLNDLYWRPGGNPGLKPEEGWSIEGGASLDWPALFGGSLRYSATAFNRYIDNWILWGLVEGQPFFSANNLTKVHSRGLEQRLRWKKQMGANTRLRLYGGYDYIRSTNEVALEQPSLAAGEQLAYTPEHQAFALLEWEWKALRFSYQHRWVGRVRSLNNNQLPGYQLGHLQGQYQWAWQACRLQAFARLDNLWDADYRILDRRPMPGRHYRIGIHVFFKQVK